MWSLGVFIGGPVAVVITLAGVACLAFSLRYKRRHPDEDWLDGAGWGVGLGVTTIVLAVGISAIGYYPYSKPYHYWTEKSGVVAAVDKRVLSDGSGGMNHRFVVRFTGSPQEYACDDTRCSLIRKGDRLRLSCKRHWQYAGRDGWDCQYNQ